MTDEQDRPGPFTAAAVLHLVDEVRTGIDDPVAEHVGDLGIGSLISAVFVDETR